MTRAAIYARRSTAEQGASLGSQIEECRKFAGGREWEVTETYADTASGWKADTARPEFDRMVRDAGRRSFDVLIVWEVSRLSRQEDSKSALGIVWDMRGLGVEVHSVIDPRTGVKLADDMTLLIKSHLAKEESDTKSKRVTRGKRRGAVGGVYQGARPPYGHRLTGKQPHGGRLINFYEADPDGAAVVRRIVDDYLRGESPQTIADALTAEGIEPPRAGVPHPYQRQKEPVWHQGSIRHMLANPLIAGFATYKGDRVKGCACASLEDIAAKGERRRVALETWDACEHEWVRSVNVPGVIAPDVWERVARVIEVRKSPAKGRRGNHSGRGRNPDTANLFLLAGLVWCGNCGERIGIRADRRTGEVAKDFYRCRGRRIRAQCDLPHIDREELDEAVRMHFVAHFVDSLDVQATIEAQRERHLSIRSDRAAVIRDELSEVEAALAQDREFRDRFTADFHRGAINAEQWGRLDGEYAPRVERAEQAVENLRAKLAEVERDFTTEDIDRVLDHIDVIREMVEGRLTATSTPELNLRLREVFERFTIGSRANDEGTGTRLIVEPRLRVDWLPPIEGNATPRLLDFAEAGAEGIEVIDHLEPALRKVDLADGLITDSCRTAAFEPLASEHGLITDSSSTAAFQQDVLGALLRLDIEVGI